MDAIRVAVVDEHEIFRRGVAGCLAEDPLVVVVLDASNGPVPEECDVAVVSPRAAAEGAFPCPVVICAPQPGTGWQAPHSMDVTAVLPRSTLTTQQLSAAVRAAASGLAVRVRGERSERGRLDERRVEVLRLLAGGADTREISNSLQYSERTIKGLIGEIERELGARSRAQAVAEGIRLGLI